MHARHAVWSSDTQRPGRCWDFRDENNCLLAYVMYYPLREVNCYHASTYAMGAGKREFATLEEARDFIEAVYALSH